MLRQKEKDWKYDIQLSSYQKATALKAKYKLCGQIVLQGIPDYDLTSFDLASFDLATWDATKPLPVYFVSSPEIAHYPAYTTIVDSNLDTIVDTLLNTNKLELMPEEEVMAWEKNNPHPDAKRL